MRRSALVLALLASTALTPTRADALPVVGFLAGAFGITAGASIAGFAAGAAFVSTAIGAFVMRTAVGIGLALLASKLSSPAVATPSERMVNFAQTDVYAEWVWGTARKGGFIGFTGFTNSRRYYVPILAAHPIDAFVEHWLDERVVTLNSETSQSLSNIATAPIAGYGRINTFDGGAGQVADAGLVAAFDEVTEDFDFKGLSGAVIWAKRPPDSAFSSIYPNGRQWTYAPVIRGNPNVYDPRIDSTGFTDNAALVIADWIVSRLGRQVDWDEIAIEADAADVMVINGNGDDQRKWTLNGTLSDDQDFEDQRAQLCGACDAYIYERSDGRVGFWLGRWVEPTLTLTDEDFYSLEITEGSLGAGRPDEVAVTYVEPENAWVESPAGTWVERAVGYPTRQEPQLYLINNHNQASRMAKRLAKTGNAAFTLEGSIGLVGYELLGGAEGGRAHRFLRLEHTGLGYSGYIEIAGLTRDSAGVFKLSARSVLPSDFDFDAATEEPERPVYDSVTNDGSVPAPIGLNGGAFANGTIQFYWDAQEPAYTQEVRYRLAGEAYWLTAQTSESATVLQVTGFTDGDVIEAQIRNRTSGAGVSDWAPATPIEIDAVINPVAPAALSAFAAVENAGNVDITWTAPNDENYFATRIYRGIINSFSAASVIHTDYGISTSGQSYTDVGPLPNTYYYWGEPINASGVPAAASGPAIVIITSPEP